jgi:hypothetical protein
MVEPYVKSFSQVVEIVQMGIELTSLNSAELLDRHTGQLRKLAK